MADHRPFLTVVEYDPHPLSLVVGRNLKAARLRAPMTVRGFARAMRVSRRTVAKWEDGSHLPSKAHLRRAAALLGTTVADLFDEPDDHGRSAA